MGLCRERRICSVCSMEHAIVLHRKGYKRWTSGNWQAKGCVLLTAFPFFFFFFYFFKVVILKLQDYPSLSHIVILVPPTVGNKVKR